MTGTIKVSGNSVTTAVAGAIAGVMRQERTANVQAIGAKAVNQAAKAIVIARVYLQEDGLAVACIPRLVDVDVGGETRTALRFTVMELDTQVSPPRALLPPETTGAEDGGGRQDSDREPDAVPTEKVPPDEV